MARRGSNAFKRNDAIRALRSARDGGLEPVKDGTIFRVYAHDAASQPTPDTASAKVQTDKTEA
jgi:hypothetical protein